MARKKHGQLDTQAHYYHLRSAELQDRDIHAWFRAQGIDSQQFWNHPNPQDIVLLVMLRDEYATELASSRKWKGVLDGYWGVVYRQQRTLRPKAARRLEQLWHACEHIRQQQINTIQTIHQLRNQRNQKADHDMTAKGSGQPQSMSVKGEQLVCREDLRANLRVVRSGGYTIVNGSASDSY